MEGSQFDRIPKDRRPQTADRNTEVYVKDTVILLAATKKSIMTEHTVEVKHKRKFSIPFAMLPGNLSTDRWFTYLWVAQY